MLPFFFWIKANPIPCNLDASVSSIVSRFGSNGRITMCDVRSFLIFSKADWCSGSQFQIVPLFSGGRIALVMCDRSGMKHPSWFANLRNALTSLMQDGVFSHFKLLQ